MNSLLVAAMIMVLGASPSARARDLQVEAVTASGAELPDLREAVERALVVGGARVVMRGPTTGVCEDCAQIKVTEISQGLFRVEAKEQDKLAATTLDLSSGARLLDRARAIAIHAQMLVGRPASERTGPEATARPAGKPEVKSAPQQKSKPQVATVPAAQESSSVWEPERSTATPAPPPIVLPPAAAAAAPEPVRVQNARVESRPPSRAAEAKRPVAEAKAEPKAEARQETTEATRTRTDLVVSPASASAKPLWPWIPMALGTGAAIGAGVCALVARQKYNGLSDRGQSLDSANALKSSGEKWQTAAFVLSGVAAAGLGVGVVGFAVRPGAPVAVSPIPGGGMAMMTWGLP